MATAPFTIVLDHPARHIGRRLWRWASGMFGVLVLTIGLLASIPAVPATLAVISFVAGWLTTDPAGPDPWPTPQVPVREIVLVWAIVTPVAIAGMRWGLRLLRRNRRLVLFLRRFGYDAAQSAVTFAVARTIGARWRVVTLDDAEIVPVGVPASTRRLFAIGGLTTKRLIATTQFLGLRMFPILVLIGWGIVLLSLATPALAYIRTGTTTPEPWMEAVDPLFAILASVFEWQAPLEYIGPTLPGAFAVVVMAAAVSFAVMVASVAALILALPLSTVLFFISSSADAVRSAEQAKHRTVETLAEVQQAARDIARRTAMVFGPRLVVLRVATPVWQDAVRELARVSVLPVIDISEPSDNVVWELGQLLPQFGGDCICIGQHDRVLALAAKTDSDPVTQAERRLLQFLAGREVLAYTTDPRGLRRFARALRGTLITRQID